MSIIKPVLFFFILSISLAACIGAAAFFTLVLPFPISTIASMLGGIAIGGVTAWAIFSFDCVQI